MPAPNKAPWLNLSVLAERSGDNPLLELRRHTTAGGGRSPSKGRGHLHDGGGDRRIGLSRRGYSGCSARAGLSLDARHAGSSVAITAMLSTTAIAPASITGSDALTL